MHCARCGKSWETDKQTIWTIKSKMARGWRTYFCTLHLTEWLSHPDMEKQLADDTITITNA